MKTNVTKEVKNTNVKTSKKENSTDKANVKNIAERQTTVKERNFLYKFQIDKNKKLTSKEEKKQRNKIRRNLKLLVNQIILDNMKKKDFSNVQNFVNFYKETYILNDFSLKSLTNVQDETKIEDYTKVLNLCKEFVSKK